MEQEALTVKEAVAKYFDMVYKLAAAETKDLTHADDVVQEVFLRYIQKHDTFKSEEHRKAWLIRVTVNCSRDVLRSPWYKRTEPLKEDIPFSDDGKSELYYAVHELPEKYRTAIHLYYYEGLSVKEIGEYLRIKESNVKSRLKRGREMLKSALKGGHANV